MGTCQSQHVDPLIGKNVTIDKEPTKQPPSPLRNPCLKRRPRGRTSSSSKLSIILGENSDGHQGAMSPSGETQPETPVSLLSPSSKSSRIPPELKTPRSLVSMIAMSTPDLMSPTATTESSVDEFDELRQCSLIGLENIMIPEETDPDAPSDEEESYLRYVEHTHKQNGVSAWEMEPGPIFTKAPRNMSPPRPQSAIKLQNKKITRPGSIQYHDSPLVVPPPGAVFFQKPSPQSVDRSHLAVFSKLKVQAKLQQKEASMKRRRGKLEDRYSDVQSYRRLYKEFEDMQSSVDGFLKERKMAKRRSKSIDLSDPESWWYNFHSMADDSDDDTSDEESVYSNQSQYSLLSAASLESQRRFYAAKKAQTTSSKLKALEDILQGIKNKKMGGGGGEKSRGSKVDDYGPPSRQNSLRRLSISSVQSDNVSRVESDYGPVSRRNSNGSSIGYNIYVDCGREASAGVKKNPKDMIELGGQAEMKKFSKARQRDCKNDDELSESSRYMMQSSMAARNSTPEREKNPAEAETPVHSNTRTPQRKSASLLPPSSDEEEDEKKEEYDRQPRWRSWEEPAPKEELPARPAFTPSIATMSTEDFLLLSQEAAVVRIMRMPDDDVPARRLAYDEDDDEVVNTSISTIDK